MAIVGKKALASQISKELHVGDRRALSMLNAIINAAARDEAINSRHGRHKIRDYPSYNDFLAFLSTKNFDLEKIADEVLKHAEYAGISLTSREYYSRNYLGNNIKSG